MDRLLVLAVILGEAAEQSREEIGDGDAAEGLDDGDGLSSQVNGAGEK